MFQQNAEILWNRRLGPSVYQLGLKCPRVFERVKPGQFVMVRIGNGSDPLLRRPFSVHRPIVEKQRVMGIELLYKVVGKGTTLLAALKQGQSVNVLGPLGSAFLLPPEATRVFIVAGGIGVAPLVFLASDLIERGIKPSDSHVFLGGRTGDELLFLEEFSRMGYPIRVTTDDGTAGDQCLVTHPVELSLNSTRPDVMYACGPLEMLKCVTGIAEAHAVVCQVSIETTMACGMGACLGCAVPARDMAGTYYHTCLDGPVFDTRSILLE